MTSRLSVNGEPFGAWMHDAARASGSRDQVAPATATVTIVPRLIARPVCHPSRRADTRQGAAPPVRRVVRLGGPSRDGLDEVHRLDLFGRALQERGLPLGLFLEAGSVRVWNPDAQQLHAAIALCGAIAGELIGVLVALGGAGHLGNRGCGKARRAGPRASRNVARYCSTVNRSNHR